MITISIVMHHHHLRVLPAKGSEEFVHLVSSQAGETEAQAFQAGQASVGTIMILGKILYDGVSQYLEKAEKKHKTGKAPCQQSCGAHFVQRALLCVHLKETFGLQKISGNI